MEAYENHCARITKFTNFGNKANNAACMSTVFPFRPKKTSLDQQKLLCKNH